MAESWFLKVDGIDGESTDVAHKGEIDVLSWSWGVANTGSPGSGGGGGAGKASFQDFQFVSRISKASPQLFLSCATGSHHKSASLSGRRAAGKSKDDFLTYKLTDVQVTSVHHGDGEADPPTEQFSLSYRRFEISFTPPTGPAVNAGFDLKLNKKV
ncbi:MAG TPA: type VI secretion system tube protein Hcp [Acidimicrobiales bacterium]|nr:type VI secretion system tube protein Hcp [Acidimicrobiales bacterium]